LQISAARINGLLVYEFKAGLRVVDGNVCGYLGYYYLSFG
jgi:hypothetical protein